ncbi:uncharacterized protein DFL_009729 [Arthrobotrys flagrans]|uniref:Uncharacterized protein n=1 Tax=Arthrobotrys flagrans TaxID=97331 RepID=A0A436ZSQ8_ARTFL|nr:hypothetical protein DFL_009729 [Arthrobotrys flagrans]
MIDSSQSQSRIDSDEGYRRPQFYERPDVRSLKRSQSYPRYTVNRSALPKPADFVIDKVWHPQKLPTTWLVTVREDSLFTNRSHQSHISGRALELCLRRWSISTPSHLIIKSQL